MAYRVDGKFLEQMDQELTGWSNPAARLRSALDNDELVLYGQLILAIADAAHYPMAEVLVRMRAEEKALLSPGEFLPVFEHYQMMPQLDRWVVRTLARRLASGSRVPRFSVNLSGQTLDDPDFPDFVAAQAKAAGIAPSALLFEIDESDLLARPRAAEVLGVALARIGSGTLIDGFGRRAVSFAPLVAMRVAFMKVDGAITRRLLASSAAQTKMKAIVRVGAALGFGVIAECVEEPDVLERLRALGAGYAQGFGISRPQPIGELAG